MQFQWKRKKGSLGLPSVERPHILRDPPKSIHTRKKERVEAGDVTYLLREMPDRYAENIEVHARGVNNAVGVNYNNWTRGNSKPRISGHSSGTPGMHSGSSGQAGNPYKVGKDGAFRPPMVTQEDLLPLSRMPRKTTSVRPSFKVPYQHVENHRANPNLDMKALVAIAQSKASSPFVVPDTTSRSFGNVQDMAECLNGTIRTNHVGMGGEQLRGAMELDRKMTPYSVSAAIGADFGSIAQPNMPILDGRPTISVNTTPGVARHLPVQAPNINLRERLNVGGFEGKGSMRLMGSQQALPNLTTKMKPIGRMYESVEPRSEPQIRPTINLRERMVSRGITA